MVRLIAAAAALLATVSAASAAITPAEAKRLETAATIVQSIKSDIPEDVWSRARCVAVIPDLKEAAFMVGGEYGKGVMSCRAGDQWSAPVAAMTAEILSYSRSRGLFAGFDISGGVLGPDEDANVDVYGPGAQPRTTTMSTTDDDLRARIVDIQQSLDRILADTTPAAVGTSGTTATTGTPATGASTTGAAVTVERARLMQLRQQLDALLASLNRR